MKKRTVLTGIISLLLVFGMVLVACDTGTNGGGGDEIPLGSPKSQLYSVSGVTETLENAGATLEDNLNWLDDYAVANGDYIIKVSASGSMDDIELMSWSLANNVDITLTTVGAAEVIIGLKSNGRLFTVGDWEGGDNITLTLDGSITLRGKSSNVCELVRVNKDAELVLTGNAKITGNNSGGGVQAEDGGKITMSGGKISGNNGGGVKVEDNATFTMNNGTISGNTSVWGGGGVCVRDSGTIFTMNGGTISGNKAERGGGVGVERGAFALSIGTISNNTASQGGGVGISGSGSSFTMTGGTISGNTASNDYGFAGGGLYVFSKPGEVSTFNKTGGIIYGDTDNIHTPGSTENTVVNGAFGGHAVWLYTLNGTDNQLRNADAGPSVNVSWDGTTPIGFDASTPWG
ncbi:hypothetical protein AGMMS49944_23160 [Spirochaetia bacterium]|nr:hypothetical protein AGMMS49944_23160 [Spirochaetia bacterium]